MNPIHLITHWSAVPSDETPLCGADKDAPTVWNRRTIYVDAVTCQECLKVARARLVLA